MSETSFLGLRTVIYPVDDLQAVPKSGAREHRPLQDVGGGIRVASVLDPFGNAFGIIENPHFRLGG